MNTMEAMRAPLRPEAVLMRSILTPPPGTPACPSGTRTPREGGCCAQTPRNIRGDLDGALARSFDRDDQGPASRVLRQPRRARPAPLVTFPRHVQEGPR